VVEYQLILVVHQVKVVGQAAAALGHMLPLVGLELQVKEMLVEQPHMLHHIMAAVEVVALVQWVEMEQLLLAEMVVLD
jgi:hypothetical protein